MSALRRGALRWMVGRMLDAADDARRATDPAVAAAARDNARRLLTMARAALEAVERELTAEEHATR